MVPPRLPRVDAPRRTAGEAEREGLRLPSLCTGGREGESVASCGVALDLSHCMLASFNVMRRRAYEASDGDCVSNVDRSPSADICGFASSSTFDTCASLC